MSAAIAATLALTRDNPSNTTIIDADDKVLYTVHTTHDKETVMHVQNADEEELASLEWHDVLPDNLGHPREQGADLLADVLFKDDLGRKYKWRGNAPGRSLELFVEDDEYKEPIARFLRSRNFNWQQLAQLVLTARAVQIRDLVVILFLFLKKSRRTNETASQSRADILSTPVFSGVTGNDYNVKNRGIGI